MKSIAKMSLMFLFNETDSHVDMKIIFDVDTKCISTRFVIVTRI